MTFFDRKAEVVVGVPGEQGRVYRCPPFTVKFNCRHDPTAKTNKSEVILKNIDASDRRVFNADTIVQVRAGYENGPYGLIFRGDVKLPSIDDSGVDTDVTFKLADGERAVSQRISTSLGRGAGVGNTSTDMLSEAIAKFQEGDIRGSVEAVDLSKASDSLTEAKRVLSGRGDKVLDELTRNTGDEWYVQDGELRVESEQASRGTTYLLKPDTGLKGSVKRKKEGLEATAFLIPSIRPKRLVQVETDRHSGLYIVRSVQFRGDIRGDRWDVVMRLKEYTDGG